jgi:hypothetical protein
MHGSSSTRTWSALLQISGATNDNTQAAIPNAPDLFDLLTLKR